MMSMGFLNEVSMKIDGKKFLEGIGLTESTVTAKEVCDRLMSLSIDEVTELFGSCTIVEVQPTLQLADEGAYKEIYCVGDSGSKLLTDVEIKRKIKYEKSYLAKKELQRNLGPDMFTHGKHYYGCRRKRRVK